MIIVKMMLKIQKNTSSPRFGLNGDVDGVYRKTSPVQEEATKVGLKIHKTSGLYI